MSTPFELIATGFGLGVPQAAAADLSRGTDVAMTVVQIPQVGIPYRLYATVVNEFPVGSECVIYQGKPGCATNEGGELHAYVCGWVGDIYGVETQAAALKHELYHLLQSKFRPLGTHSTNTRSLMYSAWNPRKPPGFLAEDRRRLKDFYQ